MVFLQLDKKKKDLLVDVQGSTGRDMHEEEDLYIRVWETTGPQVPTPPVRTCSLREGSHLIPQHEKKGRGFQSLKKHNENAFNFLKVLGKGSFGKVRK